jgi:hypothetical protein
MAKALTHLNEVVALGHFVEVDRFADLQARRCGFPGRPWASSATVDRHIE